MRAAEASGRQYGQRIVDTFMKWGANRVDPALLVKYDGEYLYRLLGEEELDLVFRLRDPEEIGLAAYIKREVDGKTYYEYESDLEEYFRMVRQANEQRRDLRKSMSAATLLQNIEKWFHDYAKGARRQLRLYASFSWTQVPQELRAQWIAGYEEAMSAWNWELEPMVNGRGPLPAPSPTQGELYRLLP